MQTAGLGAELWGGIRTKGDLGVSSGVGRAGNGNNDTVRIEAFSDGVFAIVITLLALEIRVPHAEEGASLFDALLGLWPSYLAYTISFLQIGVV